jgi:hypothetical protein
MKKSFPYNKPWRPIELWDVEAPIFCRRPAHRWQYVCQSNAPAALYIPGRFLVLISVRDWVDPRAIKQLEGLSKLKKIHLIGTRSRDLPACSIVPQPTTLPRAPLFCGKSTKSGATSRVNNDANRTSCLLLEQKLRRARNVSGGKGVEVFLGGGVKLSPIGTSVTIWPAVLAPDDRWWWMWSSRWNENLQGKPKYSEKTCPSTTLFTTNPSWPDLGSNRGATVGSRRLSAWAKAWRVGS